MGGDGVDERGARGAQGGGGRGGPRGHDPHVGGEGARGEEAAPAAARRSLRAVVPHQASHEAPLLVHATTSFSSSWGGRQMRNRREAWGGS